MVGEYKLASTISISPALGEHDRNGPSLPCFEAASLLDQLGYIADLTLQLRLMADRMGLETLSGLLQLAHREAAVQIDLEAANADRRRD